MHLLVLIAVSVTGLLSTASAADVQLSGSRLLSLQAPAEDPPAAPGPALVGGDVRIEAGDDAVRFDARYRVVVSEPSWWLLPVAVGEAHLDAVTFGGSEVPTAFDGPPGDGGRHVAAWWVAEDGELVVRGVLPGAIQRERRLGLPAAPVVVDARGDVTVPGAVKVGPGRFWSAGDVALAPAPPPARPQRRLVLGETAVGLTVREAEIAGQARLRWRVARGEVERVTFSMAGVSADLEVEGPQVASWTRRGNQVEVVLSGPATALVQLSARWSSPLPEGDEVPIDVPLAMLDGTFRTTRALQIARDGAVEVVPRAPGMQGVAASELPTWASGLVEGAPTAAFLGSGSEPASAIAYRATPAPGPPTLVDVAQYRIATTAEGRALLRAHLAVRNDRGAFLRVRPPPGMEVLSAMVAGERARVSNDGSDVLVPLARSVETVEGLLTFPVELTLLGADGGAWRAREARAVPLPVLDVEVAVTRAIVHLPPRFVARKARSARVVDDFTEGKGITYGFAAGDARAAVSDALFQQAVSAWMTNDFDDARGYLDDLEALGGTNEDVKRLRSNLSYVMDKAEVADVAQARRVKELARARAAQDVVQQRAILEEAEEKEALGDYEAAEAAYGQALSIGGKLQQVAGDEDLEFAKQAEDLQAKLDEVRVRKAHKKKAAVPGADAPAAPPESQREPEPEPEPERAAYEIDFAAPLGASGGDGGGGGESPAAVLLQPSSSAIETRRSFTSAPEEPNVLEVSAASASVVVPAHGHPVRYQRLLLPAGAADAVPIRARRTRRTP